MIQPEELSVHAARVAESLSTLLAGMKDLTRAIDEATAAFERFLFAYAVTGGEKG